MGKWNHIIIFLFLVPPGQAIGNKVSIFLASKVFEEIDKVFLDLEQNQRFIPNHENNCNKSLLQSKASGDNVSKGSNLQENGYILLKEAQEKIKAMKELFSTQCSTKPSSSSLKENPKTNARSHIAGGVKYE
ncbi:uncharacterized protein LOC119547937 isoform X2 [Drosophila subpulchrella]|uniref:uncharacterized protein LOC119547937 isoform X2 n=1 Tax=Drosophila subpulchrella TaxID=1486046 RepID=UPI0018A12968|nr:uncharacterized protein LOC119547937 isoform X2 [Drosophila subpulchrella]